MQISILLTKQIAELFLMILMGYVLVKAKLLKASDSKVISMTVLYLVIPCVIINAFQVDVTQEIIQGLELALAASLILQLPLLLLTWVLSRMLHLDEVEFASVYYSNSGNLIVPIVTYVLGGEWVIYGCVFMCVQLIFLWSHGLCLLSGEKHMDPKKIILNVNMISIAIGVVLFFTGIRLPGILSDTISSVGSMIGPLSMIVAGMLIAGMNLKEIFTNRRVYFSTFLRLIVLPLAALLILKLSGIISWNAEGEKIVLITFLAVITPASSTVTQMCQVYGKDSGYASAINVMTTVGAIVTMPLMVLLFQAVM